MSFTTNFWPWAELLKHQNWFRKQDKHIGSNRKPIFFGAKARFISIQSNVNSISRLIFGNPLACQSLEICFNKQCHHLKIWVTNSYINPLLISIKNCEQNYNWLVEETKFWAPLKPICMYFANNMLIAFCVQSPAIFLHRGGKFPCCSFAVNLLHFQAQFTCLIHSVWIYSRRSYVRIYDFNSK